MMNWILSALIALSTLFAALLGRMGELSTAALSSGAEAVEFCLQLAGSVAVWCGIMQTVEESGLSRSLARFMKPVTGWLFAGLEKESPKAVESMSMNIVANIIGLGSAATPMALEAMSELDRINKNSEAASDYMISFTVLNTASFQLVPTTAAAIRAQAGSASPLDIIVSVWLTSAAALFVALFSAKLLNRLLRRKRQ
ncbi:MAG: nucleoside recognition domain-containing protein [Oscillospiraceae bacterium]|nr:nucleoside recognition domain-containing protein [Oscillospiraceae bacterium]